MYITVVSYAPNWSIIYNRKFTILKLLYYRPLVFENTCLFSGTLYNDKMIKNIVPFCEKVDEMASWQNGLASITCKIQQAERKRTLWVTRFEMSDMFSTQKREKDCDINNRCFRRFSTKDFSLRAYKIFFLLKKYSFPILEPML